MENNKLKFLKTQSVEEFKQEQGIEQIEVLQSDTSGKCFFAYAGKTGAVTSSYPMISLDKPVVSEVCSQETGEIFMLLHNKGEIQGTQLQVL